jgi:hypothetical protein
MNTCDTCIYKEFCQGYADHNIENDEECISYTKFEGDNK